MIVNANFVCDGSANNGKIQLLVEFTDPGVTIVGDVGVYWGITDPNGIEIKTFNGPDPYPAVNADAYLTPNLTEFVETLVDIPLGSDGNYVLGSYTFRLYMKDTELGNDIAAEYEYAEVLYNFDFQTPVQNLTEFGNAVLAAEYNCLTGNITATDSTSLDGYTLIERVLRLTPPNVPGYPAPVSITTALTSLVEAFAWNNAYYQVSLSVERSYNQDNSDGSNTVTTTVLEMLTAQVALHVVCDTAMCDAAACLDAELVTLADLACDHGSWENIPTKSMVPALKKTMYGVLALLYKECGDYNKSATNAAIAGDCDCGCGDTVATTDITPYSPPA